MNVLPPALDKLATLLSRLPGVGKRTATRYAYHILGEGEDYAAAIVEALEQVRTHVHYCASCHMLAEDEVCRTCRDPTRDRSILCVLESVQDLAAIERTGAFRGLYHVMHGVLAPLKGVGPAQLRLDNLEERIQFEGVEEVIVATSADVEGEATALYLGKRLAAIEGLAVTRIATGVPMGGELEYLDQSTLSRALQGRVPIR